MRRKIIFTAVLIFSIFISLQIYYSNAVQSPTIYMTLSKDVGFKLPAYNTTITFDYNLSFTDPDTWWVWHYSNTPGNATAITLVDVWMKDLQYTEPGNLTISAINANITIHKLFYQKKIILTAYPPSKQYFQIQLKTPYGMPKYVSLTYSDGTTSQYSLYANSYQDYLNKVSQKQLVQYYDSQTQTYYLGSPSKSPVKITISYTTPPSSTIPALPPLPGTEQTQEQPPPQTSEAPFKIPVILFYWILGFIIIILIAILYIYRCLLLGICKR